MCTFIPLQIKQAFVNFERFIASRLSNSSLSGYTRPLIRIAIAGVALSIAVMLISIAVVTGFQQKIRNKVFGFAGQIQISRYDANESFESKPVSLNQSFYPDFSNLVGISHLQPYASKAGIIKTNDQIEGIVLKGVGRDYDWKRFSGRLVEGRLPNFEDTIRSDEILVSTKIAQRLLLDTGSTVRMYFVGGAGGVMRGRKFVVSGLYQSGMEEFDRVYVLGDIRHVQKLQNWDENEVSGFEVFVDDYEKLDEVAENLYTSVPYDLDTRKASELYPQIFDWLQLQDMNVIIILVLMIFVSVITMISALLIIILERIHLIGVLKSLGASNGSIRRIFLFQALRITLIGILIGNIFGLGLSFAQNTFGILKLSEESYYLSEVPVQISFLPIAILDIATLIVCVAAMLLPSMLITRIQAVKIITMR